MKKIFIILVMLIAIRGIAQSSGWVIQSTPTTQNLHGISFSNANTWIAVGDAGTIIRTSNGGINWTIISSPITDALHGVSFRGDLGLAVATAGRIIRTTDGGLSWAEIPRPVTRILFAVSIGTSMSVITGEEGTILVSTNDGLNWAPHTAGTASILFGVSVNGTAGVAVGGAGAVVMTVNNGSGWGLTVLGNALTFFYATSFVNGSTGWAVGTLTSGGVIIKSSDGGFVWTLNISPTTEQLYGVSFAVMDTGTAVGTNGAIIHTVNGGTNWVNQTSGTNQILNAVSFANSNLGFAAGNSGIILKTTNGGVSGIQNISNQVPLKFSIKQNYPNPFNPSTKIRFEVPDALSFPHAPDGNPNIRLVVYDINGREVQTLVNESLTPGTFEVSFNGSSLNSGVYFCKISAGSFSETIKMLLIK